VADDADLLTALEELMDDRESLTRRLVGGEGVESPEPDHEGESDW